MAASYFYTRDGFDFTGNRATLYRYTVRYRLPSNSGAYDRRVRVGKIYAADHEDAGYKFGDKLDETDWQILSIKKDKRS